MNHTREELKDALRGHMERVAASSALPEYLLHNPEYRTAACLLSIMEAQDMDSPVGPAKLAVDPGKTEPSRTTAGG